MRISDWSSDVCSSDLMGIQCSITAEASVLVYAKNEKAARASILHDMKCYEGNRVHRSDSNGWNGWHMADDVEVLSIKQDKHGKPLRHSFDVPVDLLASPDLSWYRYEPDQLLEAFRRSEAHTSELQSLMRISYA